MVATQTKASAKKILTEATDIRGLLLAIISVLEQLERLRKGKKTDEPFTDFEQLFVDMFWIGADGCERITGRPLFDKATHGPVAESRGQLKTIRRNQS